LYFSRDFEKNEKTEFKAEFKAFAIVQGMSLKACPILKATFSEIFTRLLPCIFRLFTRKNKSCPKESPIRVNPVQKASTSSPTTATHSCAHLFINFADSTKAVQRILRPLAIKSICSISF